MDLARRAEAPVPVHRPDQILRHGIPPTGLAALTSPALDDSPT